MNFDDNQWYHIYIGGFKDSAFVGTYLVFGDPNLEDTTKHNTTTGAVFQSTNQLENDEVTQKWQIIAIDSEYHVLRTAAGGPNGYLATFFAEDRTNLTSRSLARMVRDNVSDASVYWKITSWRDGTFQLTNKANGTDLLLEIGGEHDEDDGTEAHMSSNFTNIGRRQFSFEPIGDVIDGKNIGKIDNDEWSRDAISLPATTTQQTSQTATMSTSGTNTADSTNNGPTNSAESDSSSGLSTGAKAGIGAGIGVAVLIALVVLGLFLFRRRKRRAAPIEDPNANPYQPQYSNNSEAIATTKYGYVGEAQKAELDSSSPRAELHHHAEPAELPGGEIPRQELGNEQPRPNAEHKPII